MTRAELLKRISSRELTEWMAFWQLEPYGAEIGFVGSAIVAATVANVNRQKGQKAYSASDFMPEFGPKQEQTVEEMIQIAAMYTAVLGGQDLRNKEE